jgi:hypothetical protein
VPAEGGDEDRYVVAALAALEVSYTGMLWMRG